MSSDQKIILVIRETRLEELKARFNTVSQARFYIEHMGGDFAVYEEEDAAYQQAVAQTQQTISSFARLHTVRRAFLPNFIFGPDDTVVALGQDGLVANTLKYLRGQPLVGVNPDPKRYDGLLLPFVPKDLRAILPELLRRQRATKRVTMARATLNNGQVLYAVNDLFIGPKSHGSARYTIHYAGRPERQSSSGIIVSTGLGSTGWFSSLITGARGVAAAFGGGNAEDGGRRTEGGGRTLKSEGGTTETEGPRSEDDLFSTSGDSMSDAMALAARALRRDAALRGQAGDAPPSARPVAVDPHCPPRRGRRGPISWSHFEFQPGTRNPEPETAGAAGRAPSPLPAVRIEEYIEPPATQFPWDADELRFTVREPFPSRTTGVSVVFGCVSADAPLSIESHMPERGVIFSDGIESDFVEFNAGARAEIAVAERKGVLVV